MTFESIDGALLQFNNLHNSSQKIKLNSTSIQCTIARYIQLKCGYKFINYVKAFVERNKLYKDKHFYVIINKQNS